MDQEKVAKLIKEIRINNNLTQKDFAEKYGVTYQAVSKWENAKNIPDIALLKQMSKDFNIDINDILEGNNKKKKNTKKMLFTIIVAVLISIIIYLIFFNKDTFNFKKIESNCTQFNISGSLAYNNLKSSIYISNIDYCGEEDNNIYKEIDCKLYEKDKNKELIIDKCINKKNITLNDYLSNVSFNINDYSQSCKNYSDNDLYLEITAIDKENKSKTFKVPLTLTENCK